MADKHGSISKSLPLITVPLVVGAVLGFMLTNEDLKGPMLAGIIGVGFGLLGALIAMQIRILAKMSEATPVAPVPEDEKASDKICASIDKAFNGFIERIEKRDANFNEVTERLDSGLKRHAESLENTAATISSQVGESYGMGAEAFKTALSNHIQEINDASMEWHEQYRDAFVGYLARLEEVNTSMSSQFQHIASLGTDISQLLKIQESVSGALNGINSTEDLRATLGAFKDHLAKSDHLLQMAAKPRFIELVESDVEE